MLKIRIYPDPILREKCHPVPGTTKELKKLSQDMLRIMYANHGVGLAAPQVGRRERLIVVDVGEGPVKLLNPKIISSRGAVRGEEGCLSLPGIFVKVKRSKNIEIKGLSPDTGELIKIEAENLLARALQHEVNHLDGILIIDMVSLWQKWLIKKKLKELAKERE